MVAAFINKFKSSALISTITNGVNNEIFLVKYNLQ